MKTFTTFILEGKVNGNNCELGRHEALDVVKRWLRFYEVQATDKASEMVIYRVTTTEEREVVG